MSGIARSSFSIENVTIYKHFKQINIKFSNFNLEAERIPRLEEEEANLPIRNVGIESDGSFLPEDEPCTCTCRRGLRVFRRWNR